MNAIIEDYLTIKIDTKTFVQSILNDKDLQNEISEYLPTAETQASRKWESFPYMLSLRTHGFNLMLMLQRRFSNGVTPSGKSGLYDFIYKIVTLNGYRFEYNDYYRKRFQLLMDVVPDYVGGNDAEEYIDSFVSTLPVSLNADRKKKQIKKMIKISFLCKGKNKPKWIQEPEWPVIDKPLTFISQHKNGNKYTYIFEDMDTMRHMEIIQYA